MSEQRTFGESPPPIIHANKPHMALLLLLDTSISMRGDPIRLLNEGVNRFKEEVSKDDTTRKVLDVAIIEFNTTHRIVQEFVPVQHMNPVNLTATGGTNMSPAIREALNMVDERSRFYGRHGTAPYRPWVYLISDGEPNDDISAVAQEIKDMEKRGKVSFRSLGVPGYDSDILHKLCGPKVLKLDGVDFTEFFDWLNKSMRVMSQTEPGERAQPVQTEGNLSVDRNPDWD